VAVQLGFNLLDSGAVYRVVALHAIRCHATLDNQAAVLATIDSLQARFEPAGDRGVIVALGDEDVSAEIRTEAAAAAASRVAVMPAVRTRLLELQRSFRQAPGLVADGRDMGTIVFPDAALKVFLTASAERRAERRAKQLKDKGITAKIADLARDIGERDARDASRPHSPLIAAADAITIDSSDLSIKEVVERIAQAWAGVGVSA